MTTSNSILVVSEDFYSIQGEGASAGTPAVFLRLAGCNLQCSGFSYIDPKTQKHLGCDTKLVWRKGKKITFEKIIGKWTQHAWLEKFSQNAHLVITGGEPLLHQISLKNFITYLDKHLSPIKPFIEIETNGTLLPSDFFLKRINQFNISPKLAHSGEPREKAYRPEILAVFSKLKTAKFKFVLAKKEDIKEILEHYVTPFHLKPKNIWLMPEGGTQKALQQKARWLVEICKEQAMHYSPRLQIDIWNEVTGV